LHINRRAIVYGCLTNFGVSIAATILVGLLAAAASSDPASLQIARQSAALVALRFILLLVATAAGGYVAARRSPRAELTNALAVGVVITILAILSSVIVGSRPDLLGILGIVLTIPAGLTGGLVRLSRLERPTATG
jgi:hypothetical protein